MMSSDQSTIKSDLSSTENLVNVTLTNTIENVNSLFLDVLPNNNSASTSRLMTNPTPENVTINKTHRALISSKLKKGDLVYIITFVNVHRIYVRNVNDHNNEFHSLIKSIQTYCSTAKSIRNIPKLNDIVGAKFKIDKLYYRAKILKKLDVITYRVQFIDYGNEEIVKLSDMVSLPTKFIEIPSKISLLKLKDIELSKLNKDACAYVDLISDYEAITIDYIQEETNYVILKTSTNQNINSHLNTLIFGQNNNKKTIGNDKSREIKGLAESTSALITKKPALSHYDDVRGPRKLVSMSTTEAPLVPEQDVYGRGDIASVSITKAPASPEHDVLQLYSNDDSATMSKLVNNSAPENMAKDELHGDNNSSIFKTDLLNITKKPVSPKHNLVHGSGEKLSVGSRIELLSPPATSTFGTMTETPAPPLTTTFATMTDTLEPLVMSSVGTMTESPTPPVTSSVGTMMETPAPPLTTTFGTMTDTLAPPVMSSVGTMTESPAPLVTSSVGTMMETPAPPLTTTFGTVTDTPAPPVMSSVGTMTETPAPPLTLTFSTMTDTPPPSVTLSVGMMKKSSAPPSTSRWKRFKKIFCRCFRRVSVS